MGGGTKNSVTARIYHHHKGKFIGRAAVSLGLMSLLFLCVSCAGAPASSQAATEATTIAAPAPAASSAEDTSEPEPAEPQTAFDDVSPEDPFFAAAEALADKGLLEGVVSGRTFGPDTEVTLKDLAQIAYNLAGQPKLTAEQQSAAGSTDALKWLSATIGYGDYDDASSVVTRSEFAAIVYLLAAKFDGELPAKLEAVEFEDVTELTMLEQTAISAVYEAGLVEAEAPEFLPEEAVERKDIVEPIDELAELYPPGTELAEAFPEEVEEIIHYEELEAARIAEEQRLAAEQAAAAEQARLAEEQRQREEAQRQQEQQAQQPAPAPATPEPAPAPQPEPTPAPAPQPEPVQPASGGFLSADIAPEITSYATSIGVSWVGGVLLR